MNQPHTDSLLAQYYSWARLKLRLDGELAHDGLGFEELAILNLLEDEAGMSLFTLGEEMGLSAGAMLQKLKPLEKIGLVRFEGELKQRRIIRTQSGGRLLRAGRTSVEELTGR
ncbi:MAG: winged helix-turn-helix transcriptional regulator [Pseudomonadales bacterium]|nr:winged helix-turn-helix transcriptional regulator [Pseudomonadales bacterium]